MRSKSSTTVKIKNTTLKRLAELKPHPRCTHSDVIELLIASYDKKQVKLNGQN